MLGTLCIPAAQAGAGSDMTESLDVDGTRFIVTRPDGSVLDQSDLVGSVILLEDPTGKLLNVRIDSVEPDPEDPDGEVVLYGLSQQDPESGAWHNLCRPDRDGVAKGFPLKGTWTSAGDHLPSGPGFSLTCTSGALGKCVRMGYKPWATAGSGTSLWAFHEACTRMVRADYCGDGESHTREGILINVFDRLGIQVVDTELDTTFEAGWGPGGAVCVRKVRIPEDYSLEELERSCPRLRGKIGDACTEDEMLRSDEALVLNRS